jgi:hypothetical protein
MNIKKNKLIMKTTLLRVTGVLAIIMLIVLPVMAQDNFPDPEDDIPIDGGITLLLAAGAGYGAKKIRSKNKK